MAMRQIGLIILLFFTSLAYAQNVEFKASAPSVVAVGEQFKLEYTLNKEGDNLKVPTLEGFDLLMGPSVGQSFYSSNINGKMTQNVTFSYTYILEGTKKGTFQIPGATVIIDGKEYTSNALKIEVVEGSRNSNGNQVYRHHLSCNPLKKNHRHLSNHFPLRFHLPDNHHQTPLPNRWQFPRLHPFLLFLPPPPTKDFAPILLLSAAPIDT